MRPLLLLALLLSSACADVRSFTEGQVQDLEEAACDWDVTQVIQPEPPAPEFAQSCILWYPRTAGLIVAPVGTSPCDAVDFADRELVLPPTHAVQLMSPYNSIDGEVWVYHSEYIDCP